LTALRFISVFVLLSVTVAALGAGIFAPHDYAVQYRDHVNEPTSHVFPLGTDALGRDRLSRLIYGSRVSLLGAPAAALAATVAAAGVGLIAGYVGGWADEIACMVIDMFLSLPWLFLLLTLRALLPLNTSPASSLAAIFMLLAMVGWAPGARVVRASVTAQRAAPSILQARAYGCGPWRLLWRHILPNLRPILFAQFWILVPVFLLTEANLGVLGLGVAEPVPSWGNMLAELQNYQHVVEAPWVLAPALLLILAVGSLYFAVSGRATWE
jgi:peptide/nickel transport system permease protein